MPKKTTSSSKKTTNQAPPTIIVPENFGSIIHDFLADLSTTFPEYVFLWSKWNDPALLPELFEYVSKVFPQRFFDILYQNEDIFSTTATSTSTNNNNNNNEHTQFLPNVDFKMLYHCRGITETTRQAIWKYLQLILMTVLKTVQHRMDFGDTANIFEGVDESVLQDKLRETMEGIGDFFKNIPKDDNDDTNDDTNGQEKEGTNQSTNAENTQSGDSSSSLPNADDLHEHLKGLFNGKIGSLAKELAEEISKDAEELFGQGIGQGIGQDKEGAQSTQDLLKMMMRNPKKLMDLIKNIGAKVTKKMQSGEISQEEIMQEASEWMKKMKEMGGGKKDFADMMKNMAKGLGGGLGGGKNMRFNPAAFDKMEKKMAAKERMQQKLDAKLNATGDPTRKVFHMDDSAEQEHSSASAAAAQQPTSPQKKALNDDELEALFSKQSDNLKPNNKKKTTKK
jgi:hypothetical protein